MSLGDAYDLERDLIYLGLIRKDAEEDEEAAEESEVMHDTGFFVPFEPQSFATFMGLPASALEGKEATSDVDDFMGNQTQLGTDVHEMALGTRETERDHAIHLKAETRAIDISTWGLWQWVFPNKSYEELVSQIAPREYILSLIVFIVTQFVLFTNFPNLSFMGNALIAVSAGQLVLSLPHLFGIICRNKSGQLESQSIWADGVAKGILKLLNYFAGVGLIYHMPMYLVILWSGQIGPATFIILGIVSLLWASISHKFGNIGTSTEQPSKIKSVANNTKVGTSSHEDGLKTDHESEAQAAQWLANLGIPLLERKAYKVLGPTGAIGVGNKKGV